MRLTERSFENAAVHYLRRFPSSSGNLRRVLWRKARRADGFAEADEREVERLVELTVKRMLDAALLDDEGYAKALAQSLHRRGRPLRAIGAKLREKAVEADVIDRCLAALKSTSADLDLEAAWALAARKRLGPYRADADARRERKQKDLATLARAGFSYDVARRVIEADAPPEA